MTSNESGADHPSRGLFRSTALGAAYDCSGIQRLICADLASVNNVLARSVADPNARDIVIVVNDPEYGGWGGSLAIASTHVASAEIALHELGHSFALLVDEYGGPPPPSCALTESSAANATVETRRNSIKWNVWIDEATSIPTGGPSTALPGLYEGARYCDRGMFRPTYNSKMRSLGVPFEQVNVEAHVKRIYNLVSPIDAVSPEPGAVEVRQGETRPFSVDVLSPSTHGMDIGWSIDGTRVGSGPIISFAGSDFSTGLHTLTVTVADPTPLVRSDPAGVLRASETWSVEVLGPPPSGGPPRPVPGTIEAEDFDAGQEGVAYHDTTISNLGREYRDTDVDIERTADGGGGYNVGWMPAGEWLRYTVSVTEDRSYTLIVRVAASGPGGTFHVEFDGVDKTGPLAIPNTGGWQSWTDVTATVTLKAGVHEMRVVADGSSPAGVFGNLNYLRFVASGESGTTPFAGTPWSLPGTIEAEDFDRGDEGAAYHDTTTSNAGGEYRPTDVDIERTADGGGYNIGWMPAGEWLNYTISVPEHRTYTLIVRVAANGPGGTFHVEFDRVDKTGPMTIPNTGGWQSWRDVTATVTLNAGVQGMRVVADGSSPAGVFGNLNYLRFVPSGDLRYGVSRLRRPGRLRTSTTGGAPSLLRPCHSSGVSTTLACARCSTTGGAPCGSGPALLRGFEARAARRPSHLNHRSGAFVVPALPSSRGFEARAARRPRTSTTGGAPSRLNHRSGVARCLNLRLGSRRGGRCRWLRVLRRRARRTRPTGRTPSRHG